MKIYSGFIGFLVLAMLNISAVASPIFLSNSSGNIQITDWNSQKNKNVVKQNFDFSCGASSLSTIFNHFYQSPISEQKILQDMNKTDGMATFLDMAKIINSYGFKAQGLATNYHTLMQLKIPVVVYLNHRRNDHFSVLRAATATHVYLADSSWGNRRLSRQQFEQMWHTRNDAALAGRILMVLPQTAAQQQHINAAFTAPTTSNRLLEQLPLHFAR